MHLCRGSTQNRFYDQIESVHANLHTCRTKPNMGLGWINLTTRLWLLFPALWSLAVAFSGSGTTVSTLPSTEINAAAAAAAACMEPGSSSSSNCSPKSTSTLDDLTIVLDGTNVQAKIETAEKGDETKERFLICLYTDFFPFNVCECNVSRNSLHRSAWHESSA